MKKRPKHWSLFHSSQGLCTACPLKARCAPKSAARPLWNNAEVEPYHQQARELLNSPPGREYRSRRMIEAESVFGQIKHNGNFRRFFLRGFGIPVSAELYGITADDLVSGRSGGILRLRTETLFTRKMD